MAELFAPDSAAEERVIERTAETVVERRGPAVQRVVTKVKRRSQPARSTEPSMAGFRCVLKCFYSENISRIQNPPY